MDETSASHFASSLAKSIQTLCSGHIRFSSNVEVIGHIHVNIDRSVKLDYVVAEEVSKTASDGATFTSHSYQSLPPHPPLLHTDSSMAVGGSITDVSQQVPEADYANSRALVSVPLGQPESELASWSGQGETGDSLPTANLTISFGPSPLLNIKQENDGPTTVNTQDCFQSTASDSQAEEDTRSTETGELDNFLGPLLTHTQGNYDPSVPLGQEHIQPAALHSQANAHPAASHSDGSFLSAGIQLPENIGQPAVDGVGENPQPAMMHGQGDAQSTMTRAQENIPAVAQVQQDTHSQSQQGVARRQENLQQEDTFQSSVTHNPNIVQQTMSCSQEFSRQTVDPRVENSQHSVPREQENIRPAAHISNDSFQLRVSSPLESLQTAGTQREEDFHSAMACSHDSNRGIPLLEEAQATSTEHSLTGDSGLNVQVHNPGYSLVHIKEEPPDDSSDYVMDNASPSPMNVEQALQNAGFSNMLIERLGHQIEGTQLFFLTDQGQQQPFPVMLHTMPGVPGHVSPRIPTSVRLDGASPVVPVSMAPESEPAMSRKTLEQPSTSTETREKLRNKRGYKGRGGFQPGNQCWKLQRRFSEGGAKRGKKRKRKNLKAAQKPSSSQYLAKQTKTIEGTQIRTESTKMSYSSKSAILKNRKGFKSAGMAKSGLAKSHSVKKSATGSTLPSKKKPGRKKISGSSETKTSKKASTIRVFRSYKAAVAQKPEATAAGSFKGSLRKGDKRHKHGLTQLTKHIRSSWTYTKEDIEAVMEHIHGGMSVIEASWNFGIPLNALFCRSRKGCKTHAGRCSQAFRSTHKEDSSSVLGGNKKGVGSSPQRGYRKKQYSDEALELAMQDVHAGSSIQEASICFHIPKSTLYMRSNKGCSSHSGPCCKVFKMLK